MNWIKIEDGAEMPDHEQSVLCVQNNNDKVLFACYYDGNFHLPIYSDRQIVSYWNEVTHWQPLPQPPKQ